MSDAKDNAPTPAELEVPRSDPDTLRQSRRSWQQRAPSNQPARSDQRAELEPSLEVPSTAGKAEAHKTRPSGEDTLLSAPAPSDASEFHEERLADAERRLDDAEARLHALEHRTEVRRAGASPNWLGWVVFLLALAVVWLIWHAA